MPPLSSYEDIVRLALAEDIGNGDVTSLATIPADATARAVMVAKQSGIVCGLLVAETVFRAVDAGLDVRLFVEEGAHVSPGERLMGVTGNARAVLTAERTALNFVQRLSGIATATRSLVDAVSGTRAKICDTRKTVPGMRVLDKYAVACGGGVNHRMGLHDAILIKDNHIAVAGGVRAALDACAGFDGKVEIEVDTLDQLRAALEGGAKFVLLDNMAPDMMREAVAITAGRAVLEASGGITPDTLRAVAETGVDVISVGALTHSVRALDVGLDITV